VRDDVKLAAAMRRLLDAVYERAELTRRGSRLDHPGTEALVIAAGALEGYDSAPALWLGLLETLTVVLEEVPHGAPPQALQHALRPRLAALGIPAGRLLPQPH
jgi:hypothetical protein